MYTTGVIAGILGIKCCLQARSLSGNRCVHCFDYLDALLSVLERLCYHQRCPHGVAATLRRSCNLGVDILHPVVLCSGEAVLPCL